ncbi:ATP-binding cassette domain-containing protein [Streptomyces sp. NPDC056188]|uniref:ATP-binding cassette domain-containing protein n=1 Tax=Streptomyces sp. NPDC056188 TaxID=3345740 RepID=UPI0035E166FF
MEPIASLSGIAQGHGRHQVITGLDWDLGVGVHGLLGPNGAGKTTLLRTLATIAPPQEGALEICGRKVHSERTARAARPMIGCFSVFPAWGGCRAGTAPGSRGRTGSAQGVVTW